MDRYVVAGNPVQHSRSPFIHAAFARQTGQAIAYDRLQCPLDGFAAAVRAFAGSTEGGPARGCNVTVPFKFDAYALAARHTDRARLAGAVNTLRFDAEGWLGDNTDGVGLVRDLAGNAGATIEGARLLVVGAGGAAAGAIGPLLAARPAVLVVANRTVERARSLVERHRAAAGRAVLAAAPLADCGGAYDIVVNASAASLGDGAIQVAPQVFAPGALALDMMYGAPARPFLEWAEAHGARGRDGLGMLVEQAAEAFALWRGVRPDAAPVLAELRRRVDAGLA